MQEGAATGTIRHKIRLSASHNLPNFALTEEIAALCTWDVGFSPAKITQQEPEKCKKSVRKLSNLSREIVQIFYKHPFWDH
jgi:hypothetical protein